jgi:hypothetical protein
MARAPQQTQRQAPQPLESPAVRRSRILSDMLEQSRQAPPQIQSGGELAARLLAQGLNQFSANRADRAVQEEQQARIDSQRSGAEAALARLLGGPEPDAPAATGVQIAPIEGSTPSPAMNAAPNDAATSLLGTPAAAPAPMAPQAPQAAPNPLGPTPGEAAYIRRLLSSGEANQIAEAQAMVAEIEQRVIAPPEFEIQMVNGVPFRVDPRTGQTTELFQNGIPRSAQVRDEFNPDGTTPGTFGQRDPFGRLNLIERPPEGFEAAGGRLQPRAGGPQDPTTGRNQISNERELRQDFERVTQEYRTVRQAAATVEASFALGTGIGDVGGIFATMKMFDPTSTVREGEFATASNSGGVPDYIMNTYNRLLNGERLTPEQRQQFVSVARSQLSTYEEGYNRRVDDFTRMATGYGLNTQNIVGTPAPPRERPAAPVARQQSTPRQQTTPPREGEVRRWNGVSRTYNPNLGRSE